jgi:hypothetical protein
MFGAFFERFSFYWTVFTREIEISYQVTGNPMLGVDVSGCKTSKYTQKSLAKLVC